MFYNNRPSNNNNSVNVNTQLYTSYSDQCMIKIGAWNQQLSLKFHPAKGVNADGLRIYAQENAEIINTSLTVDNATALLEGVKEKIEPARKDHTAGSISVPIGSGENKKVLTIKTDGTDMFVELAVHVGENNAADPSNILTHKFNKRTVITNYNPADGSGEISEVESDYLNFIKKIECVYDLAPATAHAINYNNAIKQSFANRNNNMGNQAAQPAYQAPNVSNYSGADMSDFLPYN